MQKESISSHLLAGVLTLSLGFFITFEGSITPNTVLSVRICQHSLRAAERCSSVPHPGHFREHWPRLLTTTKEQSIFLLKRTASVVPPYKLLSVQIAHASSKSLSLKGPSHDVCLVEHQPACERGLETADTAFPCTIFHFNKSPGGCVGVRI